MIFWPFILGGIFLAAFISGCVGVLCTHDNRNWVPGLLFGLPAIIASLLLLVLFFELGFFWIVASAIPPLIIGSAAIWRGFRIGRKRIDYFLAVLVFAGVCLLGIAFFKWPDFTMMIWSHILPGGPVL